MFASRRKSIATWLRVGACVVLVGAIAQSAGVSSRAMMPDFSLVDVNASSATSGQSISPRDHLRTVSAWYFAHST